MIKKQSAASNQEIGAAVGGMSGFVVAKAHQLQIADMAKDEALRKEVEKMATVLSRVKG